LDNTYYGYLNIAPSHSMYGTYSQANYHINEYSYDSNNSIWEEKDRIINNNIEWESIVIGNNVRYYKHWTGVYTCTYHCSGTSYARTNTFNYVEGFSCNAVSGSFTYCT
jgi:hypothetical protein